MLERAVLIFLLLHCLSAIGLAQKNKGNELKQLREEFIQATNEYKASLAKLLPYQEEKVKRAEAKLAQSRKQFTDGLTPRSLVEENERALADAKAEVAKTQRDITNADAQAAGIFAETAALQDEYKRAVQQRRRARKPKCSNWTLTAYQRSTPNSISFGYKLVCLN